jgi:predicted ABC-type transport system involved in lysophospholipase L1 biosynthesis ATPase subunit
MNAYPKDLSGGEQQRIAIAGSTPPDHYAARATMLMAW